MSSRPEGLRDNPVASTSLTHIDGERGLLTVAGYAVAEIAPRCSFEEACFLLFHRRLPNAAELEQFACRLAQERELPAGLWAVARQAAADRIAPMDALMILAALLRRPGHDPQPAQIVTKLMMVAGWYARLLAGAEPEPPPQQASHVEAYLHLVAGRPPDPAAVRALETYLVTVMDHGLNASTFAARVAASTHSDLLSCTLAALATLKGPRHGGAPGPALEMVERIPDVAQAADYLRAMLDRGERLMGFGHGVYRVRDPRADVLAVALEELIAARVAGHAQAQALYRKARAVEQVALRVLAEHRPQAHLQTNVEFYTALLLHAIGLERELFTPTFAVARVVGWLAHASEQRDSNVLLRPRARYRGPRGRRWLPLASR